MKYLFLISFILFISSCSVQNIEFEETGVKSTLTETLDSYFDANLSSSSPGMAILVIQDGIVTYSGTRGMANENTDRLIDVDSGFRLASVSKSFTALVIDLTEIVAPLIGTIVFA